MNEIPFTPTLHVPFRALHHFLLPLLPNTPNVRDTTITILEMFVLLLCFVSLTNIVLTLIVS